MGGQASLFLPREGPRHQTTRSRQTALLPQKSSLGSACGSQPAGPEAPAFAAPLLVQLLDGSPIPHPSSHRPRSFPGGL